jgi:quinone-modifying oxidoreductase subunit QmoC
MAALRDASIAHYAAPVFLARALADPRYLPLLLAIPILIFLGLLGWLGHLETLPEGRIVFSKLLPILYIEGIFVAFMALATLGALGGGVRYWRAMSLQMGGDGGGPQRALVPTVLTILRHRKFSECQSHAAGSRATHKAHLHGTHLAVFYGFLGLVVTTTAVGIGIYGFGYLTPWPLWHPVKILGNVSGLAAIAALAVFAWRRIADGERAGKSTYSDWLFLAILLLTTLTGFLCQALRLADLPRLAYPMYVVHLVLIFFLLVYIPYSKFAHLVYRTVAMLYDASRAPAAEAR